MAKLNDIFPAIKDPTTGKSVKCCARGCKRVARHMHHMEYRCNGGSDDQSNLKPLCDKCHRAHHSAQGDFKNWGKLGGKKTAEKLVSMPNLVQFRGPEGAARWEAYLERRAAQQMGMVQ